MLRISFEQVLSVADAVSVDKVKEMITIKQKKISVDKFYEEIKKFNNKK